MTFEDPSILSNKVLIFRCFSLTLHCLACNANGQFKLLSYSDAAVISCVPVVLRLYTPWKQKRRRTVYGRVQSTVHTAGSGQQRELCATCPSEVFILSVPECRCLFSRCVFTHFLKPCLVSSCSSVCEAWLGPWCFAFCNLIFKT